MNDIKDIKDKIIAAYIEAIYFTETGEADQPSKDIETSEDLQKQAEADVDAFLADLDKQDGPVIASALLNPEQVGHDLWLTRNHHGVGFWDREEIYGTVEHMALNSIVDDGLHPERYAYEGDDGLLYLE